MLPTINGKSFLEVTEDDLKVLVENTDYRESDYIDYKRNFAFLEITGVVGIVGIGGVGFMVWKRTKMNPS